jgi:CheY-like chemotaxis protein
MSSSLPNPLPSIIIVDDSIELVRVYARFFEMAGLRVAATFFDGEEVVDYVRTMTDDPSRSEEAKRSVIVTDYRMPKMNGADAARVIREMQDRNPIIILVTGEEITRLGLPEDLFDGVLRKPFSIADFLDLLKRITKARMRDLKHQYERQEVV